MLAASALVACELCQSDAHGKRMIAQAIVDVAGKLGNTPAIYRQCYPQVITCYLDGSLHELAKAKIVMQKSRNIAKEHALTQEELLVIHLLKAMEKTLSKKMRASSGKVRTVAMPLAAPPIHQARRIC